MRFLKAGQPARSKLGLFYPPNTNPITNNNTFPAVDDSHSVLMELFCDWKSAYNRSTTSILMGFADGGGNLLYMTTYNASNQVRMTLFDGGWDENTRLPLPGNASKNKYIALLFDRTNNRKRVYEDGSLAVDDPIGAVNPTWNAPNMRFNLWVPGWGVINILLGLIIVRITSLTSVPVTMPEIIKHQYMFPMELDPRLVAVKGTVASQWDVEDFNLMTPTVLADHGDTGGKNLGSSITLADKIRIVEKP